MSKSIKISGDFLSKYNEIISDEALRFVQEIHEKKLKTHQMTY